MEQAHALFADPTRERPFVLDDDVGQVMRERCRPVRQHANS
jgi:hypothetical protein